MSKYCKVGLGIDAIDYADLKDKIQALKPDLSDIRNTTDCCYLIFYWDWKIWAGDDVEALLRELERTRHSLVEISEDGNIFSDIETCDKRGSDEEFNELISWDADIQVWNEPIQGISPDGMKGIIQLLTKKLISISGVTETRDFLTETGVSKNEIHILGLHDTLELNLADDHPDWNITLEELNRVIADLEFKAVIDDNDLVHVEDLQDGNALVDEYFKTPQDVINRLVGSFLDDVYLNGMICCDIDKNFDSYQEAESAARKKGYIDEADRIRIILKAQSLTPNDPLVDIRGIGVINENGYYESGEILVDGKNVLTGHMTPYPMRMDTERYIYVGIHGENPGCYKYLDYLLIVRKKDKAYKILRTCDAIGNRYHLEDSALRSIGLDESGNVIISSDKKKAKVITERIFAENVIRGTLIPDGSIYKLENCFEYEIVEDYGVIMTLKKDIPKSHLLRFRGFGMNYDTFKFWDLDHGTSYLLFINSVTGGSFQVNWGNSTTMTSESTWQQRDALMECLKKIIPNHPAYRDQFYFEKI